MIYNMPGGSKHITASGMEIMVPILKSTWQGLRRMDEWLLRTMREEAVRRKDAWTPGLFDREKPGKFPPATRDSLNDYIFDGSTRLEG